MVALYVKRPGGKLRLKQRVLMMKQLRTIWKTILVIFMAAFLAACSGNTKQNEASQEAERRAPVCYSHVPLRTAAYV